MSDRNEHGQTAGDVFGLQDVRELLRLISETDVTEIQIERGDAKLHIKRGSAPAQPAYMMTPTLAASLPNGQTMPYMMPAVPHAAEADGEQVPEGLAITSPMVGTFYRSPSPKDAMYVNEGDDVRAGDVVGIVEAMKIMNEIESEVTGRVIRILVSNGQPVEYGQPLMIVEAQ